MFARDTIFALSSGSLPAGVAVVRLSGPDAAAALRQLAGTVPEPRRATLRWIRQRNGMAIDQALVLWFPGPASFTGEDCVEFHLHGGRAVVMALLGELENLAGLRHAEAGEFSRRAFDNGKLDLVEIEGLADLISAETEMQRRLAIEQSSGRLSALYVGWSERLTRMRALIEAELDFPDEEDVPGAVSERIWSELRVLADEMKRHVSGAARAEIVRDGFRVAIVGPPNAGKSSLMNALARRDVAIVTEIAGTTRDVLGVDLDINGYLVHLMDTAGIRETEDIVEQEGVRRAFQSIDDADLVLLLRACDAEGPAFALPVPADKPVIAVQSKSDLLVAGTIVADETLPVSSRTGDGFDSLTKRIVEHLESRGPIQTLAPARRRQVDLIQSATVDIEQCLSVDSSLELKAEYLRLAAHNLGKITGRVDVEDLLDVIFSEFCIGK